ARSPRAARWLGEDQVSASDEVEYEAAGSRRELRDGWRGTEGDTRPGNPEVDQGENGHDTDVDDNFSDSCPSDSMAEEEEHAERVVRSGGGDEGRWRSEEHTSELQSRSDLVCRLLLEKKNR